MTGWNLPPGCTYADIDRNAGVEDDVPNWPYKTKQSIAFEIVQESGQRMSISEVRQIMLEDGVQVTYQHLYQAFGRYVKAKKLKTRNHKYWV